MTTAKKVTEEKSFNKAELVRFIAKNNECSLVDAENCIKMFTESVISAAQEGHGVDLVGFGSFSIKHVEARTGRNPKTGETMPIKASNKLSFKAGKRLKDACN